MIGYRKGKKYFEVTTLLDFKWGTSRENLVNSHPLCFLLIKLAEKCNFLNIFPVQYPVIYNPSKYYLCFENVWIITLMKNQNFFSKIAQCWSKKFEHKWFFPYQTWLFKCHRKMFFRIRVLPTTYRKIPLYDLDPW